MKPADLDAATTATAKLCAFLDDPERLNFVMGKEFARQLIAEATARERQRWVAAIGSTEPRQPWCASCGARRRVLHRRRIPLAVRDSSCGYSHSR